MSLALSLLAPQPASWRRVTYPHKLHSAPILCLALPTTVMISTQTASTSMTVASAFIPRAMASRWWQIQRPVNRVLITIVDAAGYAKIYINLITL